MHNLVKLVQANGKALVVPAGAISAGIVRSLSTKEKEDAPAASAFVWLILDGIAQSVLVRERMGFILNKAGGSGAEREVLEGVDGERISMPRSAFGYAIESERTTDAQGRIVLHKDAAVLEKRGDVLTKVDATVLKTSLRSHGGVVDFFVKAKAADLYDLFKVDLSEDDGSVEYDETGKEIVGEDAPARKKRAGAA